MKNIIACDQSRYRNIWKICYKTRKTTSLKQGNRRERAGTLTLSPLPLLVDYAFTTEESARERKRD